MLLECVWGNVDMLETLGTLGIVGRPQSVSFVFRVSTMLLVTSKYPMCMQQCTYVQDKYSTPAEIADTRRYPRQLSLQDRVSENSRTGSPPP